MSLFKLVSYYFLRSQDRSSDRLLENLIGDLIVKSKHLSKTRKGKIIDDYRIKRKKHPKDENVIDLQ
jgi:hypothetical protein